MSVVLRPRPRLDGSIWVPPHMFTIAQGSPTLASVADVPAWLFDPSLNETLRAAVMIPAGWSSMNMHYWWMPTDTQAGDVSWRGTRQALTPGVTVPALSLLSIVTVPSPGVQYQVVRTLYAASQSVTGNSVVRLDLRRNSTDATDTYPSDAALLGVELSRAS